MTLLAFDLFGKSNNPETWSVISMISSGAIHLNLTKETNILVRNIARNKTASSSL